MSRPAWLNTDCPGILQNHKTYITFTLREYILFGFVYPWLSFKLNHALCIFLSLKRILQWPLMLTDGALANSFPLICHCQALFISSSIGRWFYPLNLCDDDYFCCKQACRCASMFSPQNDCLVRNSDLELCHRLKVCPGSCTHFHSQERHQMSLCLAEIRNGGISKPPFSILTCKWVNGFLLHFFSKCTFK